jgi:hypothetical protein
LDQIGLFSPRKDKYMSEEKSNSGMSGLIPVVATLFAAAIVLIVSFTFDGPGFGTLWPLIPTILFAAIAFVTYSGGANDWWPGSLFLTSFFILLLLSTSNVIAMARTWPFLVLIAGVLVVVVVVLKKKQKSTN